MAAGACTIRRSGKMAYPCKTLNCCHKIEYGKYCQDCQFDRAYLRGE